jgi:type III pantothenate kinase
MLLAVDIGNSSIHFGLFRGRRLAHAFAVPTKNLRLTNSRQAALRCAQEAIICSVVPRATPKVAATLRRLGVRRVRLVGRDVRVPLKNRYRRPREVGQDRLVGAYAAWQGYARRQGKARRACIIADFGTAITIDAVSRKGEYLGGVIVPGLQISLDALAERTALLPRVSLKRPSTLLCRDTATSIRSGLVHGFAALADGLIGRLRAQYAPGARVVLTGGVSPLLHPFLRTPHALRPFLVLDGLRLLAA